MSSLGDGHCEEAQVVLDDRSLDVLAIKGLVVLRVEDVRALVQRIAGVTDSRSMPNRSKPAAELVRAAIAEARQNVLDAEPWRRDPISGEPVLIPAAPSTSRFRRTT